MIPCVENKCLVYSVCRYRQIIRCELLHDYLTSLALRLSSGEITEKYALDHVKSEFPNTTMIHQGSEGKSDHRWSIPTRPYDISIKEMNNDSVLKIKMLKISSMQKQRVNQMHAIKRILSDNNSNRIHS